MKFYFEYSPFFLIAIAIISIALAIFLYHKDKTFVDLRTWKKHLLITLRTLFIFFTLSLLLNPIVKHLSLEISKPIIVIAQDNSKSIIFNKDSAFYRNEYKSNLENFAKDLSENYDVKILPFSENISDNETIDFSGEATDINSAFKEIQSRYAGANVGAVILASDGIVNKGQNPKYSKQTKFPIYCVALGDTIPRKDILIKDVVHNSVTFLGNKFPLRIYISADKCTETSANLNISKNSQKIFNQNINIPKDNNTEYIDIELPADKIGLQQYKISIQHLENEISYENNETVFFINVIDKRNKVLLIGDAPHPDIGAIKSALKNNPDIEISVKYIYDNNINVKNFDLIITHQLPSLKNKANNIFSEADKYSIPQIFILGTQTSYKDFDNLKSGLKINSQYEGFDDAIPTLNSDFSSFSIENPDYFKQISPLKSIYGNANFIGEHKILLTKSIKGIKTDKPMLAFCENGSKKNCFIIGEGIWKWKIDDYKNFATHDNFNSLINKIVQYTITKSQKDKLIIESKHLYNSNENVIINSEFYNETFELTPNLEIELTLKDSTEKEFKYKMEPNGNTYRSDLGKLPCGKYNCEIKTEFDSKSYSANTIFYVHKINLESQNLTANHKLLYQIAEKSNGKVFYPENFQQIKNEITSNPSIKKVAYQKEKLSTISDFAWLFFCILLFATAEWFLRKFWGGY